MMQRLLPHPAQSLLLLCTWLLLVDSIAFGHWLLGGFLAIVIPLLLGRLLVEHPRAWKPLRLLRYLLMVIVDILVANVWMAFLLFLIPRAAKIDRWMGADTRVIDDLRQRMESYHAQHARNPTLTDLMIILGIGLGTTGLAHFLATPLVEWIKTLPAEWKLEEFSLTSTFFWMVVIATTVGLLLSFTRARQMEGAGASKVGTAMLYILSPPSACTWT